MIMKFEMEIEKLSESCSENHAIFRQVNGQKDRQMDRLIHR